MLSAMMSVNDSNNRSSEPDVSPQVAYVACEVTVGVLATAGNALVLLVFWRERHLRRLTNYYIVALATADLFVGFLGVPMAILTSVGLPRQTHLCLLGTSVLVVLCTISIFCLLAVSLDRYWAILHPLAYSRTMTSSIVVGIIVVCWVLGTIVGMLPMMGWNAGPYPSCAFTKVMDYNYLVFLYFATIIAPAILLAYFYAHIYQVVLRQRQPIQQITPNGLVRIRTYSLGPEHQLRQITTLDMRSSSPTAASSGVYSSGQMNRLQAAPRREVRAAQNLSKIVLLFMLCWIPLYTINCVQAFCPSCYVPLDVINFTIVLSHANSAVNPLLYAYHLRDFRAALRALVCHRRGRSDGGGPPGQPSVAVLHSGMSKRMSGPLQTIQVPRTPPQPQPEPSLVQQNHAIILIPPTITGEEESPDKTLEDKRPLQPANGFPEASGCDGGQINTCLDTGL